MTLATSRAELERWLASAAFNSYYRFRLREIGAAECTIEVPFRDEFERPGGTVSGPVFMAAADVAVWFAVATRRGIGEPWVTADLKTAFLRAARREPFTCTARALKIGRHLVYAVAECARQDGTQLTHGRRRAARSTSSAKEAGVTASTLTRMAQGKRPDVDGLAALIAWSGLKADHFVRSEGKAKPAEPLAMISTYLRSDPNPDRRGRHGARRAGQGRLRPAAQAEVIHLRRGFKTEANDIAGEIRAELGLRGIEPLDPWKLAAALGIELVPLRSFREDAPRAHRLFRVVDLKTFSAVTVFNGTERMIVYNDAHSRGRQASDITHELAHALLQHPPAPALDHRGCRYWDPELEEKADWLAGVLLITEDTALAIVRNGLSLEEAAARYDVSKQMVQFRVNMTGARRRVRSARGYSR